MVFNVCNSSVVKNFFSVTIGILFYLYDYYKGLLFRVQYKTRLWDTWVAGVDHDVGVLQNTYIAESLGHILDPIVVIDEVNDELWLNGLRGYEVAPINKLYDDDSFVAKVPLTVVDKLALNTVIVEDGGYIPVLPDAVGKVPPVDPVIGFIAK